MSTNHKPRVTNVELEGFQLKLFLARYIGRGTWLRRALGIDRRWGVTANNGTVARFGFATQRQARHWAWRNEPALLNFETYWVDADDVLQPALQHARPHPRNPYV